jgi:hypothetical protein
VTLNGTEYALQPLNPVSNLNTWGVLGADPAGWHADVAIYSSALTPNAVASHYQAALNGPAPS